MNRREVYLMTIRNDSVILWDNGIDKMVVYSIRPERQYKYVSGKPCITIGLSYENKNYKGCDTFTLFDHFYLEVLDAMKQTYRNLNGEFRLDDIGADTDGYVDFNLKNGRLHINGQLGATFSFYSLTFEFEADQTLLGLLIECLDI